MKIISQFIITIFLLLTVNYEKVYSTDNIKIGLQYVEAWLIGNGCVPLYNLMEDAATAEISRAQIWQWLHHKVVTVDGKEITKSIFVKNRIINLLIK